MSFYSRDYGADPRAKYKHFWRYFEGVDGRVLDIGCTTGNFLQWRPESVVGVDLDGRALAIARGRGFTVCRADVERPLCFADGVFTAVNCSAVLEHVVDPLALLREIRRVLVVGGRAVVLVPDVRRLGFDYWRDYTHKTPFTREGLRRIAIDAGFERFTVRRYAFNYLKHLPAARRPGVREPLDRVERALAALLSTDLVLVARA